MESILDGSDLDGVKVPIDEADRRICLVGRQKLITAKRRNISAAFLKVNNVSDNACETRDACNSGRLKAVFTNRDDSEGCDPLWEGFDWDAFGKDVCDVCLKQSRASYEGARTALWNDLPNVFDLPNWNKLRASIR